MWSSPKFRNFKFVFVPKGHEVSTIGDDLREQGRSVKFKNGEEKGKYIS